MTDTPMTGAGPALAEAEDRGGALDKRGLAWTVFEWARNPYYILVIIYVFAPYLAGVVTQQVLASGELSHLDDERALEVAKTDGLAAIAAVTKWAGFAAALTAPFLGAALDKGGRRKPLLLFVLSILGLCSWSLFYAQPDGTGLTMAMVALAVASVSYTYSEVIHNSMLSSAGRPSSLPMISGLGLALGNLAATLIFIAIIGMFALPAMMQWPFAEPLFGVDVGQQEHQRLVGPISAVWLVVFIVPFFLFAKDGGTRGASWLAAGAEGAKSLWRTLRSAMGITHVPDTLGGRLRLAAQIPRFIFTDDFEFSDGGKKDPHAAENKNVLRYLLARMLYADAMAALLALGAVYVSQLFGWNIIELAVYAIIASLSAFAGGLLGGTLDKWLGPKQALIIEISGMIAVLVFQLSMTPDTILFGLIQSYTLWDGLVFQTLADVVYLSTGIFLAITATASISSSRSMLVHLAPPERVGEFFGLYAIAGTVTVWLGPLLIEIFADISGNQRIGMSAIGVLFFAGLGVLLTVRSEKPARD